MSKYIPTIGLEVHAELKTLTKMFCNSANQPFAEPNTNICPVCMAHPGTLPVANKEAIKHVLKIGYAVGGEIADFTEFDRKNYFYPDIPKGYQISQYDYPLVSGGSINGVQLTRIHLEEDTAKSIHDQGDHSLVDFNRAGVPLMELVTEPVIKSSEEAVNFARELRLLLRYLSASEANMDKGEMRVEANISVSPDEEKLGTKVEVKNLNSFRAVQDAITYEIDRHSQAYEGGEEIVQETRGWDDSKGATFSQRKKEESHDYRYFPEPDLPAVWISKIPEFGEEKLRKEIPELPWQRRDRYRNSFNLDDSTVEIFVNSTPWSSYLEAVTNLVGEDSKKVKLAVNYITSDFMGLLKSKGDEINPDSQVDPSEIIKPKDFSRVIEMTYQGRLSSRGAKDVLAHLFSGGGDPDKIAEEKGLIQASDTETLGPVIEEILDENKDEAKRFKDGDDKILQFLVGQGMKKTKGSANPQVLQDLFKKKLR